MMRANSLEEGEYEEFKVEVEVMSPFGKKNKSESFHSPSRGSLSMGHNS